MKRKRTKLQKLHNLRMSIRAYGKPRLGYRPTKGSDRPVSLAKVSILEKCDDEASQCQP